MSSSACEDKIWLGIDEAKIMEFYPAPRETDESWFEIPNEEVEAKSAPQSGLAHKKVIERIKYVLQECRRNKVAFTDNEEKFLNDVLELYDAGTILNKTSIKIKKELEATLDCRETYEIIKNIFQKGILETNVKQKI